MSADDDWLDALGGRPRPGGDPVARAEAELLRAAQRRWPAAVPASQQQAPGDEAGLIARAEGEGLLQPRRRGWCAGCAERWRRWTASPWLLGGAGVALAGVLIGLLVLPQGTLRAPADEPVLRAGPDGLILLRDAQPQARRDRIAAALGAVGVEARLYERFGRYGLDAELPRPLPGAVERVLRAQGLAAPAEGVLRVEVEAPVP